MDDFVHNSIMAALANHQPVLLAETDESAAVMLILLMDGENPLEVVLTKRASTLPTYAGHYSFPGGMHDTTDKDLYTTAVREIQEELSLPVNAYQYVGQLDDFHDRFGHLVRPFATWMQKKDFQRLYKMSDAEIASLYYFSLDKLSAIQDDPLLHPVTLRRPSYAFKEGEVFIWGLTAAILVHVFNIIEHGK